MMAGMPKRGSCEESAEAEKGVPEGCGRHFSTSLLMLVVSSWRQSTKESLTICFTELSKTDSCELEAAVWAETLQVWRKKFL